MTKQSLTQEYLKEILAYNPETGICKWKIDRKGGAKAGDITGCRGRNGYLYIGVSGKVYLAHRLIWLLLYGHFPPNDIDHVNGVRSDNRLDNLRLVDRATNLKNQRIRSNNTSGVVGVFLDKGVWASEIKVNYKKIWLGRFSCKEDAIRARKKAEVKYGFHENHGDRQCQ